MLAEKKNAQFKKNWIQFNELHYESDICPEYKNFLQFLSMVLHLLFFTDIQKEKQNHVVLHASGCIFCIISSFTISLKM